MRQIATKIAVLTAATVLVLACDAQAANVIVGDATGNAGSTVDVSVTVATEGEMVAGTQNDIGFMPGAAIAARANGRPDCTVNPAIDKGATTFAFQPPMCGMEGQPACTGVRSLVLSFDNVTPIPDGSVLYTCKVNIAADATGTIPLVCTNPGASDPDGGALPADCVDGDVTVGGGGEPTPTATTGPGAGTIIHVGSTSGDVGEPDLSIDVSLDTDTEVAGTQNDITFPAANVIIKARANGRPDCAVNPTIDKGATTFAFQPPMCGMEGQPVCTGVRALVLSFDNVTPIPTGSVLYTCQIDIVAGEALDVFPLTCSNQGASDPDGGALPADCTNGEVEVGGVIPGESTLASAISATDTTIPLVDASTFPNSGTVKIGDELITYTGKDGNNLTGATRGTGGTTAVAHAAGDQVTLQQVVPPTATATPRVGTPTVTPPAGSPTRTLPPTVIPPINVCDDSCAITSPADARSGWLLLLPAAMLIWLRRRSR
jgi:hypothetical protein